MFFSQPALSCYAFFLEIYCCPTLTRVRQIRQRLPEIKTLAPAFRQTDLARRSQRQLQQRTSLSDEQGCLDRATSGVSEYLSQPQLEYLFGSEKPASGSRDGQAAAKYPNNFRTHDKPDRDLHYKREKQSSYTDNFFF